MNRKVLLLLIVLLLGGTALVSASETTYDAFGIQVVRQTADLMEGAESTSDPAIKLGEAEYWNTRNNFIVELVIDDELVVGDGWRIKDAQVYAGNETPPLKKEMPVPGKFPCRRDFVSQQEKYMIQCSLENELAHSWGGDQTRFIAIHADLIQVDGEGNIIAESETDVWAIPTNEDGVVESYTPWPTLNWGGYFTTTFVHPRRGHFIDSPVAGLTYETPTNWGVTDDAGGFDYFPGERVNLSVGSIPLGAPLAGHKTSPLDVFENADIDDPRVINMARLLQSLDVDADPQGGINITEDVIACLDQTMVDLNLTTVDFADDAQTELVIYETIDQCVLEGVNLFPVSAEDAIAHLDTELSNAMLRKDISRTEDLTSSKSKLNIMGRWFPALKANGDPVVVEYYDENNTLIRTAEEAKPVVVVYTDGVPETGYEDIFAAISRDDGNTFKRMNLSRGADRSSFTLADGTEYFGQTKKPVFQVKGNNILVSWSSKFCQGGRPAYAIDPLDDYVYDDPYYTDDIWGVAGPQRSHDYTEEGFPEVGELPYSCVWVARGVIATEATVANGFGEFEGDIVWFKPERLTSGRRDALQVFMGGASGAGFALVWQEDPEGVRPGKFAGPGHGWSGATTNHKTDIWYSYISWADFAKVDENFLPGGDPEHDLDIVERPKALVPMSLPVRLSDNDVINTHNILVELDGNGMPVQDENGNYIPVQNEEALAEEADGTHRYATEIGGLIAGWYDFINFDGEPKTVAYTDDFRLLDGDTGASRANLFMQPYTNAEGKTSAWAIINYEETKGAGNGPPDGMIIPSEAYIPEEGKNVIYHTFDFKTPDLVSGGTIANLPERDEEGNVLYIVDENGNYIPDWQDNPQLAYENARRARFILQGGGAIGGTTHRTSMLMVYKEGREGSGRPSDIFLRRFVVPEGADRTTHNPYRIENLVGAVATTPFGQTYFADGAMNMSTVTPVLTTDSQGDPEQDDPYGAVKVVTWEQTLDNFGHPSYENPFEDARAHRGQIRGDFVVMGYSYTQNWAAARNGNDKYDFYIRRSFDGGQTWTTMPADMGGEDVTHCRTSTDPISQEKEEVCTTYIAGAFEEARNLSQLPNAKTTVIEPRIVAAPGTIKDPATKAWTKIPEDKQNPAVYYVAYGTASNPKKDPLTGYQEDGAPLDLFYSFTQDRGESYVEVGWDVNPDSDGNLPGETVYRWDYLAKGAPEQGEAQLRMTPDGSRFYATWLQEGEEGSDIWFRRIMSSAFSVNIAGTLP